MKQQIHTMFSFWWSVFRTLCISQWRTVIPKRKHMNPGIDPAVCLRRISGQWHMEGKCSGSSSLRSQSRETRETKTAKVWRGESCTKTPEICRDWCVHVRKLHEANERTTWKIGTIIKPHTEVVPAPISHSEKPHNSWVSGYSVLPQ